MRKNLSAIGNSLGIAIEKPILKLLCITRDTELGVTTDGTRLIVETVRGEQRCNIHAANYSWLRLLHSATEIHVC